ncbi:hypothetical protein Q73_06460 [Bacillus coahuilensis m2-6]|uniref:LysM domain-containing protein n=1 Tax=Bacillus coahuilensis p1.1.43 TaxID=1150625 RepID=A0A147K910_9BACI|nr:LysM peptidoglycan-binding domain-containing protein [Bacillus coahuilensis]KUP06820.1 hypothetical protein Q75_06965 [Bacillus coahuilensis p1.1.43]KUP08377.1 hypothetical protein Q73_06460 [Bacillus coahuilensis m2-6]
MLKYQLKKNGFILSFIIVTVLLSIYIIEKDRIDQPNQSEYITVAVKSGDSLWSIANRFSTLHGLNYDQFVTLTTQLNRLSTSEIQAGQEIILPIKRTDYLQSEKKDVQLVLQQE